MNYAWLGDVIKYYYCNYIHAEATCYVASEKALEKLSDEDRAIVEECFWQQSAKTFDAAKENEDKYMKKLEDKGVKVHRFTEEEVKENAEYVRDVTWKRLEKDWGKETIEGLRNDIETLL